MRRSAARHRPNRRTRAVVNHDNRPKCQLRRVRTRPPASNGRTLINKARGLQYDGGDLTNIHPTTTAAVRGWHSARNRRIACRCDDALACCQCCANGLGPLTLTGENGGVLFPPAACPALLASLRPSSPTRRAVRSHLLMWPSGWVSTKRRSCSTARDAADVHGD